MNARTTTLFALAATALAGVSFFSACKATYRPPTGGEVVIEYNPTDRAGIYAALEKLKAENEKAIETANGQTPPNTAVIELATANLEDIKVAKKKTGYTPPAGVTTDRTAGGTTG
jgi:hypothetical protein